MKRFKENFPWLAVFAGLCLLVSSYIFKADDMAAVAVLGLVGSLIVCVNNYRLDIIYERRWAKYKESLKERNK